MIISSDVNFTGIACCLRIARDGKLDILFKKFIQSSLISELAVVLESEMLCSLFIICFCSSVSLVAS